MKNETVDAQELRRQLDELFGDAVEVEQPSNDDLDNLLSPDGHYWWCQLGEGDFMMILFSFLWIIVMFLCIWVISSIVFGHY